MKAGISTYLKLRRSILFMANPIFYIAVALIVALAFLISGRDGILTQAVFWVWALMKDISSFLFFAGTGHAQKDAHLILTVCLPSLIALAWYWMEKVTGIHGRLKAKGYLPKK